MFSVIKGHVQSVEISTTCHCMKKKPDKTYKDTWKAVFQTGQLEWLYNIMDLQCCTIWAPDHLRKKPGVLVWWYNYSATYIQSFNWSKCYLWSYLKVQRTHGHKLCSQAVEETAWKFNLCRFQIEHHSNCMHYLIQAVNIGLVHMILPASTVKTAGLYCPCMEATVRCTLQIWSF